MAAVYCHVSQKQCFTLLKKISVHKFFGKYSKFFLLFIDFRGIDGCLLMAFFALVILFIIDLNYVSYLSLNIKTRIKAIIFMDISYLSYLPTISHCILS